MTLLEKVATRSSQNHEQQSYATLLSSLVQVQNQMGGSHFHAEVMDVASCLLIHVLLCWLFVHWLRRRRRREVPSQAGELWPGGAWWC